MGANGLGLIYMNARYYLPQIGRFVSPDTIVPEPGNPQSYNRYAYTNNNPINNTDPSGHRPASGCEYEGCTLDDELDPDHTYIDNNHSPVLADPMLLEQYPAEFTAGEAAYTVAGLATVGFAPIAIEGAAAAWPALASGGSAACADGDCTNEWSFVAETSSRVFWSGGRIARAAAEGWAQANESVTIGMTKAGQALEVLTKDMDWATQARPLWAEASTKFAQGTSGEIHVFQNMVVDMESIWVKIEYPVLSSSERVSNFIYHIVSENGSIITLP